MSRPLLYNFLDYDVPDEIIALIDLLDMFVVFDRKEGEHRIYEKLGVQRRFKWKTMSFRGGSVPEWQQFLGRITHEDWFL